MTGPITPQRDPRNDWRPDSNPIYGKTNDLVEQAAKPVVQAAERGMAQGGWKDKVERLDSKGDTARSRVFLDGELDVNIGLLLPGVGKAISKVADKLGASLDVVVKGQASHLIDVTRDSNAADSTYTVRYTKMSQGGLGAELTLGSPVTLPIPGTKGNLQGGVLPQGFLRGDSYAGVANTVEMRFNSKEEAERAATALEKLAAADSVDDGIQAALLPNKVIPGSPANLASQAYEGSSNNFANPMSEYGEVNPGLRRAAGVSDEDMAFLGDHVVAQEATVMGGSRSAVEGRLMANGQLQLPGGGKAKLPGLDVRAGSAIVPGLYRNTSFTRRVEYPTDVSAGRIVDRFNAYDQVTAKWRDVQSAGLSIGGKGQDKTTVSGQHRADDNYELALANTSVSYEQSIAPGTQVDLGYLATRPPDFSGPAKVDSWVMTPTSSELAGLGGTFNPLGGQMGQAPGGQQRVDMVRQHQQYQVSGGTGLAMAGSMPLAGGFAGTLWQGARQGDFIDNRMDVVKRDGTNTTETLRLGASGLAAVEGSLTLYSGVDDFDTASRASPPADDPKPPSGPTPPDNPPPPKPDAPQPTHWQVQPYEGVNVRSSPTTQGDNKVAVVQPGSYLDGTGETKVDRDGHTWIKVHGRDQNDQMVDGWVRGDNLKAYDKRYGDNDASGRVNPAQEKKGQDKIIVKQDDNLWNLAQQYHQDFDQMLAANPHLLDPNLVFKGDSVYLPGH